MAGWGQWRSFSFCYGKLPFLIREDFGAEARGQEVSLREGGEEGRSSEGSVCRVGSKTCSLL